MFGSRLIDGLEFDTLSSQMDPEGMFWTERIEARFGAAEAGTGKR